MTDSHIPAPRRVEAGDIRLSVTDVGDGHPGFIGNPEQLFTPAQRDLLRRLGAVLVSVRPGTQAEVSPPADPDAIVVGDPTGALKRWFDARPTPVVFLRPDRFVAAAGLAQDAGRMAEAVARAVHLLPDAARAGVPSTGRTTVR